MPADREEEVLCLRNRASPRLIYLRKLATTFVMPFTPGEIDRSASGEIAMNKYDSDEYWNKFLTEFKDYPPTADRIVHAIYLARGTLSRNEQPIMDHLINALHPYTFFAEACHHMFWMSLREILKREHDPISIAAEDVFWPYWHTKTEPPPQTNFLQVVLTELATIRQELDQIKLATQKKRN